MAHRQGTALESDAEDSDAYGEADARDDDSQWTAELAMAAVLSLPLFALWALRLSQTQPAVRDFRMLITLLAMVPLAFLVFLRQP